MTNNIKKVCVFASSSNEIDEIYFKAAQELGEKLVDANFEVVYGGSRRGLMYACAGAAQNKGGKIYGIMPQKIADMGFANPEDCEEFHITKGMRERKALLDKISDAVITLAGGYGTLEEISEMIVQKQLGYNSKPLVFLNTNNFYKNLILFFEDTINNRFAIPDSRNLYFVANTVDEAINYIQNYVPPTEQASKYVLK